MKASEKGIRSLDRARIRKGWTRQDERWYKQANSSLSQLKRLWEGRWDLISDETFIRLCQAVEVNWEEILDIAPFDFTLGRVPDVSTCYGRIDELAKLTKCIKTDRCRVQTVFGAGGIGKTTLAAKWADENQSEFEYVVWVALDEDLSIQEVLTKILNFLNNNKDSNSDSQAKNQNTSDRISELMHFFRNYRCLLIIDKLDTILCSGKYVGSYKEECTNYGDLIERVGTEQHQSCLMVISRETTREIEHLEGPNLPVRKFKLKGLSEEAAWKILEAKGLSEKNQSSILINLYKGNPKILKMIAPTIKCLYNGRIGDFLTNRPSLVTGDDVEDFIGQQVDRLTDLEKKVLYKLAKANEPLSLSQVQKILSLSQPELDRAIESLIRRSLIEKSCDRLIIDPVVIDYVILKLKPEEDYIERNLLHQP